MNTDLAKNGKGYSLSEETVSYQKFYHLNPYTMSTQNAHKDIVFQS